MIIRFINRISYIHPDQQNIYTRFQIPQHSPALTEPEQMTSGLFDEVPFEVFVDFILPRIGLKEVGSLSQVNHSWRSMCDEQEVWRHIYMRGLNFRITDTSVHIGPRRWLGPKTVHFQGGSGWWRDRAEKRSALYGVNLYIIQSMIPCLPRPLTLTLLPWSDVREDGGVGNDFSNYNGVQLSGMERLLPAKLYFDYIEEEWRNYNAEKGLSTVNLCQCSGHYRFDTLAGPTKCQNSSSFKKVVLKKQLTSAKHNAKKSASAFEKQRTKIEKYRVYVAKMEIDLAEAERAAKSGAQLRDNLVIACHK